MFAFVNFLAHSVFLHSFSYSLLLMSSFVFVLLSYIILLFLRSSLSCILSDSSFLLSAIFFMLPYVLFIFFLIIDYFYWLRYFLVFRLPRPSSFVCTHSLHIITSQCIILSAFFFHIPYISLSLSFVVHYYVLFFRSSCSFVCHRFSFFVLLSSLVFLSLSHVAIRILLSSCFIII